MFLSKLWFFLISIVMALAVTVALVMPRPAERTESLQENKRARAACFVTNILLQADAQGPITLAQEYAQAVRLLNLGATLYEASKGEIISEASHKTAKQELAKLGVEGAKPSFVWLVDQRGRVVARGGEDAEAYGESVRGYYLVKEALAGWVRDDLWVLNDALYRVAAAPILTKQSAWAGAIVLGYVVDKDFASELGEKIEANVNFYAQDTPVASSNPVQIHSDVIAGAKELTGEELVGDCATSEVLYVTAGDATYAVVNGRLPGEAGEEGAFFSAFIPREPGKGFMGTLRAVRKNDLSFAQFPWIVVIGCFLVTLAIGFFLMHREVDGPLKRLNNEAISLAKEESERFAEEGHRGKYGSIARSVNIAIEKSQREAAAAKKDLDRLLGPAGDRDNAYTPLPSTLPPINTAPATVAPPPSEFKFGSMPQSLDPGSPSRPSSSKPPLPGTSAMATPTQERVPPAPISLGGIDANIFADSTANEEDGQDEKDSADDERYFREVFDEFISLKKQCGESVDKLTFERFSAKLRKNQAKLMEKHSCKSVRFKVYEKDGKAALKASPAKS